MTASPKACGITWETDAGAARAPAPGQCCAGALRRCLAGRARRLARSPCGNAAAPAGLATAGARRPGPPGRDAIARYRQVYEHNLQVVFGAVADVLNERTEKQDRHLRAELAALREDLETLIAQGALHRQSRGERIGCRRPPGVGVNRRRAFSVQQ